MRARSVGEGKEENPAVRALSVRLRERPAFLIIQGDQDTLVPPGQSHELRRKLQAAGVSVKLVIVANAGHMLRPKPPGAQINPSNEKIVKMIADFFDQHLNL